MAVKTKQGVLSPHTNEPMNETPPAAPYQSEVTVRITLVLLFAGAAKYFVESVVMLILKGR
jgi:hypothetical protein